MRTLSQGRRSERRSQYWAAATPASGPGQMRRPSSCRPPAKAIDRDLVEHDSLVTGHLQLVVGAAALLEALQRLALPRGDCQQLTHASQLNRLTIEIVAPGHVSPFGALQDRKSTRLNSS